MQETKKTMLFSAIKESYPEYDDKTEKTDFLPAKIDAMKLKAFSQLASELCQDFSVYSELFTKKRTESELALEMEAGFVLERALLTQICLRYSALAHDETKRTAEDIISFQELIRSLQSKWLDEKSIRIREFYQSSGLKLWRNKVIAHEGYTLLCKDDDKPRLTRETIEEQLTLLKSCMTYLSHS